MRRRERNMVNMGRYNAALLPGGAKRSILWSFCAENINFEHISGIITYMRCIQSMKRYMQLNRTNLHEQCSIQRATTYLSTAKKFLLPHPH